ncbi:lipopolysaccharide biosynthesis protein [Blastochloris tepida]|uniref:Polysaccharide biosynthesis protein C-terminal domain-containing protein n=1 Tax=Blastochloris tepida TaxID=2233851 RepID=A0A348G2U4_9HYPH|nr:oligosaccharide flippase family protein [Blastochloris tepida]BBF93877.1 hypothetical protein BLTE_25620 [Blastochloris tepida]
MAKFFTISFASSLLGLIIGLATGVLAARILGPADRGNLSIIVFWGPFLASILTLSLGDALVVRLATTGDRQALISRAYVVILTTLTIGLPVGGAVIYFATAEHGGFIVAATLLFWLVQACELCMASVAQGQLRDERRFATLSGLRLLVPLGFLAFIPIGYALDGGIRGFVAAHVASLVLALAVRMWVTRAWTVFGKAPAIGENLVGTALSFHGVFVVGILAGQIDKLIIIQTEAPERIGLYTVALSLAGPIQGFLGVAIQMIALPALVQQADPIRRQAAALRLFRLTWAASLAGAAATAVAAPIVVPFLFGSAFAGAGPLAAFLTIALALMPVRAALTEAFKAEGDGRRPLIGQFVFLVGFLVAFGIAVALGLEWPVVWGVAAANLAATLYQAVAYARHHPNVRVSAWAIPTWTTARELTTLMRTIVK